MCCMPPLPIAAAAAAAAAWSAAPAAVSWGMNPAPCWPKPPKADRPICEGLSRRVRRGRVAAMARSEKHVGAAHIFLL